MLRKRFLLVLALVLGGTLAAGCMPESAEKSGEEGEEKQTQVYQQSEGEPALSAKGADLKVKKKPRRIPDKVRLRNAAAKKRLPALDAEPSEDVRKAALAQVPYHPEMAPRISAEEPVFDYGEVVQGASVKHTFTIKNIGKNPLVIERAEGG